MFYHPTMQASVAGILRPRTLWLAPLALSVVVACGDDGGAPDLLPPGFDSSFNDAGTGGGMSSGSGGGTDGMDGGTDGMDGGTDGMDGGTDTGGMDERPWPDERLEATAGKRSAPPKPNSKSNELTPAAD